LQKKILRRTALLMKGKGSGRTPLTQRAGRATMPLSEIEISGPMRGSE